MDFKNREDVERWLQDKPRETAIVIAARAALRAVPALATAFGCRCRVITDAGQDIVLPTFRGTAATWTAAACTARHSELRAAVDAAGLATGSGASAAVRAGAYAAAYAAASVSSASKAFLTSTDPPSGPASAAAHFASAAAFNATTPLSTSAAEKTDSRAAHASNSVMNEIAFDARMIENRGLSWQSVAQDPLWQNGIPSWAAVSWLELSNALLLDDVNQWDVWINWYKARLHGESIDQGRQFACVLIPDEIWRKGPAVVNTHIKQVIEEPPAENQLPIEVVPPQGPGPRYRANEDGQIDRAPLSDIDEHGNEIMTINQLKPLVKRCARELQARLSRNEFPELLESVQSYQTAIEPDGGRPIEWGEVWGLGVLLQSAASAAERKIKNRILPELEDPARAALDSLLALHGPMILATREGAELSEKAISFAMTREQQEALRAAAQEVVERLKNSPEVITQRATESVSEATNAIGQWPHPERGAVYGLANIKNISIVLIGGAAAVAPTVIGAILGGPIGTAIGAPFSLVGVEAVKKSPAFSALVTQLGLKLDTTTDIELQAWIEQWARRLAPFRAFVVNNNKPLRKIAETTPELRWMLRYIDFIMADTNCA